MYVCIGLLIPTKKNPYFRAGQERMRLDGAIAPTLSWRNVIQGALRWQGLEMMIDEFRGKSEIRCS